MKKINVLTMIITIMLLASIGSASAAVLHGTVYDYSLNKVDGCHVSLGDEKDITEGGEYSFEVNIGSYNVSARYYDADGKLVSSVAEEIDITEDKTYVLDLVLFESLEEEEQLLDETDLLLADMKPTLLELEVKEGINWFGIVLLAVFFAVLIFWMKRMKKVEQKVSEIKKDKEEHKPSAEVKGEAEKILEFIKKEGRTTQKDIRKEFPSSEAKISLILTELEDRQKIKKIKKGRGNIIIYNG